jgi:hypothetical protein
VNEINADVTAVTVPDAVADVTSALRRQHVAGGSRHPSLAGTLTFLSVHHLADGYAAVTHCADWEAVVSACGIDLGFLLLEIAQLVLRATAAHPASASAGTMARIMRRFMGSPSICLTCDRHVPDLKNARLSHLAYDKEKAGLFEPAVASLSYELDRDATYRSNALGRPFRAGPVRETYGLLSGVRGAR